MTVSRSCAWASGSLERSDALVLRGRPRALLKELVPEPRALVPRALAGAARSLSAAAVRSTAARPRVSLTSHASRVVARAAPGRATRRAALTRLQCSPASHQLTSTSKRLNVRGFPPGILLQLRVAVVARGNSMGSLTLSTAAAAALPAAAGASWVCGAPGAADSRASFEPEHEAKRTQATWGIWAGRARQARRRAWGQQNDTDPTAEQSTLKTVWQG